MAFLSPDIEAHRFPSRDLAELRRTAVRCRLRIAAEVLSAPAGVTPFAVLTETIGRVQAHVVLTVDISHLAGHLNKLAELGVAVYTLYPERTWLAETETSPGIGDGIEAATWY